MGNGNMFLAIGAVVILGFLSFNINRSILHTRDISERTDQMLAAEGILQQVQEEIRSKAFDAATVNNTKVYTENFTQPSVMGVESNEKLTANTLSESLESTSVSTSRLSYDAVRSFNDVDDYNNLVRSVSTPQSGTFTVQTDVSYVEPTVPTTLVSYRTHSKRVMIVITSPGMQDTLRSSFVISY